MNDSIQVEVNGAVYELNEELVSWMLRCLFTLEESQKLVDDLDEALCIDTTLMQDVRLLLDEVEESLIEE